jgi:kynureninase
MFPPASVAPAAASYNGLRPVEPVREALPLSPPPTLTRDSLAARDRSDPLARCRDAFALPDGVIYLDGNSLGPLPKAVAPRLERLIRDEWGRDLIRSWNVHDWIGLAARAAAKIARLIGAAPEQVIVADSTSVNLFKVLAAALALQPERKTVLSDAANFPTDLYVASGLSELLGGGRRLVTVPATDIVPAVDDDTAVLMLTQVDFRSGHAYDIDAITAAAHAKGALAVWDLSHSAGVMPIALDRAGVDAAVGCGYKYLNGGPGAPAYLYVAKRWLDRVRSPIQGWMGHAEPFAFGPDYRPVEGIARFLAGTPPILALAALDAALDVCTGLDFTAIRNKSLALTDAFMTLVEQECGGCGFTIATPRAPAARGSQVSLCHAHGYAIVQALIGCGVIGDFRAPDLLRFGFAPLFTRFVDVWDAVAALKNVMARGTWHDPRFQVRAAVT